MDEEDLAVEAAAIEAVEASAHEVEEDLEDEAVVIVEEVASAVVVAPLEVDEVRILVIFPICSSKSVLTMRL